MSRSSGDSAALLRPVPIGTGQSPFLELLQVERLEAGDGRARLEVVVQRCHLRQLGILHGGVTASLLDTVIGTAALTRAPADHYGVTVHLGVNFIRPAWEGERLLGSAEVQHAGRQTAVGRGEIRTAAGVLVAAGTATLMYLPHTPQTRETIERLADRDIETQRGGQGK